ncbi:transposase [Candidatus Uabimicrobium sp. HlEnr_7]
MNQCIRLYSKKLDCGIVELNIQKDHVRFLVMIPPKVSISQYMGTIKVKATIRVFNEFPKLKQKPYWESFLGKRILC